MPHSVADLALEQLAADELDIIELAATWRAIAREALRLLHEQQVDFEQLEARHHRLLEEFRLHRERVMRADIRTEAA